MLLFVWQPEREDVEGVNECGEEIDSPANDGNERSVDRM
jgi:hypothetical protein